MYNEELQMYLKNSQIFELIVVCCVLPSLLMSCDKGEEAKSTEVKQAAVSTEVEPEKEAPKASATCVVTSKDGEPLQFKKSKDLDRKFVVLGGTLSEIVSTLGHGDAVVGTDTSSTYPPSIKDKPKVGYYRKVSAEGVLSLAPTDVLTLPGAGPEAAIKQLQGTGLKLHEIEVDEGVDGALERVSLVGKLLGEETCATELASRMKSTLEEVKTEREKIQSKDKKTKILFVYARGANVLMVSGKDTPADEMITLAGFENAVSEFEGFKPLSSEVVLEVQPDVILIPEKGVESFGGADGVYKLPGLSLTEAAKNKRLVMIDDLALLGFGPRFPDALLAMQKEVGKFSEE